MAVVEYMMHRSNGSNRKEVPGFIGDRGHHFNPTDKTFIGWVEDERDYYVPDSVIVLTKEEFVARQLGIHAASPMLKEMSEPDEEAVPMTEEEVRVASAAWYDEFVTKNS